MGEGDADPFMELTIPQEQEIVVGQGGRLSQPLIGLFGLYTAIGSRAI